MTGDFLTGELAPVGGSARSSPEDFEVEELPLREPRGRGRFAWLHVEKRRVSTPDLKRQLAALLGIEPAAIGAAGNKDSEAVTRQWLSLPSDAWRARDASRLRGARVLRCERDDAPIRLGDLRGNRFRLVIREAGGAALANARAILAVLERRGLPNFFGPQRFGTRGNAGVVGGRLLRRDFAGALDALLAAEPDVEADPRARAMRLAFARGDLRDALAAAPPSLHLERELLAQRVGGRSAAAAWKAIAKEDVRLLLAAWQSSLFNQIVAVRLPWLDRAIAGDLLQSPADGRVRPCRDAKAMQAAIDRLELHPTAPLFGSETALAALEPGAHERAVIAAEGIEREALADTLGVALRGERRAVRVALRGVAVAALPGDALEIRVELPPGSYASALLAELQHRPGPPGLGELDARRARAGGAGVPREQR